MPFWNEHGFVKLGVETRCEIRTEVKKRGKIYKLS